MILNTLINTNTWLKVKVVLLKNYPDQEQNIKLYENVFNMLKTMKAVKSRISIYISKRKDDFDETEYIDVSGKCLNCEDDKGKFLQAIEFTAWNEWLGMEICENSLINFTELEIISHCMYEMTFVDFEEDNIKKFLSNLEKEINELESMSEEERKENTISLDDII